MSEPLSAVVVAAGRSQRMGFDKLLTPLGGRPLLLHTLERLMETGVPEEVILVIRPGSEKEMAAGDRSAARADAHPVRRGGRATAGLGVCGPAGGGRLVGILSWCTTRRGRS